MLSKAQISFITSLQLKKFRVQHQLFLVEGIKSVLEFVHSNYKIHKIYATTDAVTKLGKIPLNIKLEVLKDIEFGKISHLKHPQGALAVVNLPEPSNSNPLLLHGKHSIVLDDVQDPGNLGTIIRTAEWFGIQDIICSIGTVDCYNPKVVQATMGSLSRVRVTYLDIEEFLENTDLPIFGALLNGQSIYNTDFSSQGLILMGNEGNGIREELISKIDFAVTIPRIGKAESLNVAVATTLFCSEMARSKIKK